MKKYIKSYKWKKYLKKRKKRTQKRNLKKKNSITPNLKPKILIAPKILSLKNNLLGTLEYFQICEKFLTSGRNIYLDLSKVDLITGDAILYLLSFNEKYKGSRKVGSISGNSPKSHLPASYFKCSGFYDYVKSNNPFRYISNNFYSIRKGILIIPNVIKDALSFCFEKSEDKNVNKFIKSHIARILNEGMGNVKHHAYKINDNKNFWWLMIEYDPKDFVLKFYLLDNGLGIPGTIKKRISEKLFDFLTGIFGNHQDSDYIISALNGEFRSETNQLNRGNGLPEMKEIADNSKILKFEIISNFGYVNVKNYKKQELNTKFNGTILIWEIKIK